MRKFHTQAYVAAQLAAALLSPRHSWFTGLRVHHRPTTEEKLVWWCQGPGSKDFARKYRDRFYYEEGDLQKKQRFDHMAEVVRQHIARGQVT